MGAHFREKAAFVIQVLQKLLDYPVCRLFLARHHKLSAAGKSLAGKIYRRWHFLNMAAYLSVQLLGSKEKRPNPANC